MGNSKSSLKEKNFADAMRFVSRLGEIKEYAEDVNKVETTLGEQNRYANTKFVLFLKNAAGEAEKLLKKVQTALDTEGVQVADLMQDFNGRRPNFQRLADCLEKKTRRCFSLYSDLKELKAQVSSAHGEIRALLEEINSVSEESSAGGTGRKELLQAMASISQIKSKSSKLPKLELGAKNVNFLSKGIVSIYVSLMWRYRCQQERLGNESIGNINFLRDACALATLTSADQAELDRRSAIIRDKCFRIAKLLRKFESIADDANVLKVFAKRLASTAPSEKLIEKVKKELEIFQKKSSEYRKKQNQSSKRALSNSLKKLTERIDCFQTEHSNFLAKAKALMDHIGFVCKTVNRIEEQIRELRANDGEQRGFRIGMNFINYQPASDFQKQLKTLKKQKTDCEEARDLCENCKSSIAQVMATSQGTCDEAMKVLNDYKRLLEVSDEDRETSV
ncbi:hypothetical protein BOX15_Mlig033851g2 [Macrostomum lignano]|uniref:Uncharacterized protein n=1 Tax=Macrostomum lignano TaxID=282301 RepID=A0A267EP92_9PLAT|nr:hypothetical protein BOX15_Mlig033851g2 [Macrostomum lignano]